MSRDITSRVLRLRKARQSFGFRPISYWRLPVRLEGDEWQRFFDTFAQSAWRLELHPVYLMPQEQEAFKRFLAGERLPIEHRSSWMDRVAGYISTGRSIGRVHVVRRPLSDYLLFEFEWYYRHHVKAGEDIRILDLTGKPDLGLPDHDFWMFDEKRIVKMLYQADGTQIGRELVENPDMTKYLQYREIALAGSVSFSEYSAGLEGNA
jgi:hypothetical protein